MPIRSGRRARALCVAISAAVVACGGDDSTEEVDRAFAEFGGFAPMSLTYGFALSDSNAFRHCVSSSGGEPAALQLCVDNSSDAISGPNTVATMIGFSAAKLRELNDDDERVAPCLEWADRFDRELDAWFRAATAWRTAYDADPSATDLTGDLIETVGERQDVAEEVWSGRRAVCPDERR